MPEINEKFLRINKWSRPGFKLTRVLGLVIHWVEGAGHTAIGCRNWMDRMETNESPRFGGEHYIIGLQGEIIQMIPEDEIGYHVGARQYMPGIQDAFGRNPNYTTLAIELCHPKWNGKPTDSTRQSAIELSADILYRHDLSAADLYLHRDFTGKICHKYFVENPSEWEAFQIAVQRQLERIAI